MATTTQDELYKTFLQISSQQTSALSDVTMSLSDVLAQVQEMRAGPPVPNTKAAASAPPSQANSGGDALSSVASTVLKSGFGLAPLVSGLFSLFGGGDAPAPTALVKYALPSAINFEAAETASGITGLDYNQSGAARVFRGGGNMQTGDLSGFASPASGAGATAQAPQITVNVQAMDARSFLDRSSEIALAVRDAMLNMNAINDVVNEL